MAVARIFELQAIHYLRADIAYNTPNIANGIEIGAVPAGAKIEQIKVFVDEAFNAGTTNVLVAGTTASGTNLIAASDVTEGTIGVYTPADAAGQGRGLVFASDTTLYVSYTQTGTAASTGKAVVTVSYVPKA